MNTKAAKTLTAGDKILLNGKTVTVSKTERTIDGKFGDVAVTNAAGWTFYARPNAQIPTV